MRRLENEATSRPSSPHRAHWLRWGVVLPALTAFLFVGLAALSLHETRRLKPVPLRRSEPVSEAVLARYQTESRRLADLREAARSAVTRAEILEALRAEKAEDIPGVSNLLADIQSLGKRDCDALRSLLPDLLSLLRDVQQGDSALRVERTETLLSRLVFLAPREERLREQASGDVLTCIEGALRRGSPAAAALLQLLLRFDADWDLDRLEELRSHAPTSQLGYEFDRVIEALRSSRAQGG